MISHYEPRKTMIICLLPYEALLATSNDYQPPRTTTTITNHDEPLPTTIDHYQPLLPTRGHAEPCLTPFSTTRNQHQLTTSRRKEKMIRKVKMLQGSYEEKPERHRFGPSEGRDVKDVPATGYCNQHSS